MAGEIVKALGHTPQKPKPLLRLEKNNEKLLAFDMSEAAAYFGVPADTIAQRTRNTAPRASQEKRQLELPVG